LHCIQTACDGYCRRHTLESSPLAPENSPVATEAASEATPEAREMPSFIPIPKSCSAADGAICTASSTALNSLFLEAATGFNRAYCLHTIKNSMGIYLLKRITSIQSPSTALLTWWLDHALVRYEMHSWKVCTCIRNVYMIGGTPDSR
jgi:hypothetical protein